MKPRWIVFLLLGWIVEAVIVPWWEWWYSLPRDE